MEMETHLPRKVVTSIVANVELTAAFWFPHNVFRYHETS